MFCNTRLLLPRSLSPAFPFAQLLLSLTARIFCLRDIRSSAICKKGCWSNSLASARLLLSTSKQRSRKLVSCGEILFCIIKNKQSWVYLETMQTAGFQQKKICLEVWPKTTGCFRIEWITLRKIFFETKILSKKTRLIQTVATFEF